MAADTHQEKTEAPTPRRLEKAREEGRIPVSRDVAAVAGMAACLGALLAIGPGVVAALRSSMARGASAAARAGTVPSDGAAAVAAAAKVLAPVIFPVALLLVAPMVAGSAAFVAQTRGNVAHKALGLRWDRVNLASGLARLLGNKHTLFDVLLALAKAAVLAAVLAGVLHDALGTVAGLGRVPPQVGQTLLWRLVTRVVVLALAAMGVLAAADYLLARSRVGEQIRMTKQEVKDEHKEHEGDPRWKARRRARMREIGRNRMIAATKDATVVVVNPTHYAVALRYRPETDAAPVLLAKGRDSLAARIRSVARKHGIPIVSDPPAARAIYAAGNVGHEVDPDLYAVVARVLAFLYRLQGRKVPA